MELNRGSGKGRTNKWYDKGHLKKYFHGRLRGYPGLAATARMISEFIPYCTWYVEPLAGKARVARFVKAEHIILNDKSNYAYNYCKKKFPNATVTNIDYLECIKAWDSKDTWQLIDPVWLRKLYTKNFDDNTDRQGDVIAPFCDRLPGQYYKEVFALVPSLKSNWIVCMNHNRKIKHNYHEITIHSRQEIMGEKIKVKLVSNLPFEKRSTQRQGTLLELS